jgi:hyperosmotically inducible protein
MKMYKVIAAIMFAGVMLTGLSACENEGTAEKAGKEIDEAASNVADKATELKESAEKKME